MAKTLAKKQRPTPKPLNIKVYPIFYVVLLLLLISLVFMLVGLNELKNSILYNSLFFMDWALCLLGLGGTFFCIILSINTYLYDGQILHIRSILGYHKASISKKQFIGSDTSDYDFLLNTVPKDLYFSRMLYANVSAFDDVFKELKYKSKDLESHTHHMLSKWFFILLMVSGIGLLSANTIKSMLRQSALNDMIPISGVLTSKPVIDVTESRKHGIHKDFYASLQEYPDHTFVLRNELINHADPAAFIRKYQIGDTVSFIISRWDYFGLTDRNKPSNRFLTQKITFQDIDILGMPDAEYDYVDLEAFEKYAEDKNITYVWVNRIVGGIALLVGVSSLIEMYWNKYMR